MSHREKARRMFVCKQKNWNNKKQKKDEEPEIAKVITFSEIRATIWNINNVTLAVCEGRVTDYTQCSDFLRYPRVIYVLGFYNFIAVYQR